MVVEPAQIVVTPSICERTGSSLTVTLVTVLVAEQPLDPVTVTVGEDVVETVIEAVDAPVLQRYDEPALAVNSTLPPAQKVVFPPAEIVAVGKAFTVILSVVVVAHCPAVGVNV